MAIPGYDFPSVTLSQSFEPQISSSTSQLGVACVGPQYTLHGFDIDADASFVPTSGDYSSTDGLALSTIPGLRGAPTDELVGSMRIYVHDGVFKYADVESDNIPEVEDNVIYTNICLAPTAGASMDKRFGTRGVKVGDPVILQGKATATSETLTSVPATILAVKATAEYGNSAIAVEREAILSLNSIDTIEFCVRADKEYGTEAVAAPGADDAFVMKIQGNLTMQLDWLETQATLQSGSFHVRYRERDLSYVGTLGSVSTPAELKEVLGVVSPDNPLAAACYFALMSGNYSTVYFTCVETDTATDYVTALDFLNKYDGIYSIVPCTSDADIIKACMQACINTSLDEDLKMRRTLWYGITSDNEPVMASDTAKAILNTAGKVSVTFTSPVLTTFTLNMNRDVLRVGGKDYKIIGTNDTDTITIDATTIPGTDIIMSIVRVLPTNDNIIDNLIEQREARTTSERGQCVWGDTTILDGDVYDNSVLAAAAAGMRAYEPCHRPLSNLGYNFFTLGDTRGFTRSQLRRLGSNGVWIIAPNANGLPVNMHQTTTAVSTNPNLNEESIVANADAVAAAIAHIGESFIGSSNITPLLIDLIRAQLDAVLNSLTSGAGYDVLVGPQLLSYEIESVAQDSVDQSRIYASLTCTPPRPFNKFHMSMRIL